MIIDCCMFLNEVDILELRFDELYDIVDKFVVLECLETLAGRRKKSIFNEYKDRFAPYIDKIEYISLHGLPPLKLDTEKNRFFLESFQRDQLMLGLVGNDLDNDDIILISDLDEIPSIDSIAFVQEHGNADSIYVLRQEYLKHFIDYDVSEVHAGRPWLGTVAVRYSMLGEYLPQRLRIDAAGAGRFDDGESHGDPRRILVDFGGWHFTYFGGEEALRYKLANFAHGGDDKYGSADSVPAAIVDIKNLQNLREWDDQLANEIHLLMTSRRLPLAVQNNPKKYYHLFSKAFSVSPYPWMHK